MCHFTCGKDSISGLQCRHGAGRPNHLWEVHCYGCYGRRDRHKAGQQDPHLSKRRSFTLWCTLLRETPHDFLCLNKHSAAKRLDKFWDGTWANDWIYKPMGQWLNGFLSAYYIGLSENNTSNTPVVNHLGIPYSVQASGFPIQLDSRYVTKQLGHVSTKNT
jgi:hypothetical protein